MITIKFKRIGRKNDPHFRIVVTPTEKPKHIIEYLGSYDPLTKNTAIKKERVLHWIKEGSKVSDTAYNLMVKHGVIEGPKRKVKLTVKKKEGAAA